MGERIDKFRDEEWTEQETVPWPAQAADPKAPGYQIMVPGTMIIAIPPARFKPQRGDIYVDVNKNFCSYAGEELPPGAKFPIISSWKQVRKINGAHHL